MTKASGRAFLILLAGLFFCFGGASVAAPTSTAGATPDDAGKPVELRKYIKHRHHYSAHRRSSRTALKSSDDKADKADQNAKKDDASNEVAGNTPAFGVVPPFVANARAQIADADAPAAAANAITARADDNKQAAEAETVQVQPIAERQAVTPPDQLSDADRALREESQTPAPRTVVAAMAVQPREAPMMMVASNTESSSLDNTSLIGKIFIGFGALLTLASAARMFMA